MTEHLFAGEKAEGVCLALMVINLLLFGSMYNIGGPINFTIHKIDDYWRMCQS